MNDNLIFALWSSIKIKDSFTSLSVFHNIIHSLFIFYVGEAKTAWCLVSHFSSKVMMTMFSMKFGIWAQKMVQEKYQTPRRVMFNSIDIVFLYIFIRPVGFNIDFFCSINFAKKSYEFMVIKKVFDKIFVKIVKKRFKNTKSKLQIFPVFSGFKFFFSTRKATLSEFKYQIWKNLMAN